MSLLALAEPTLRSSPPVVHTGARRNISRLWEVRNWHESNLPITRQLGHTNGVRLPPGAASSDSPTTLEKSKTLLLSAIPAPEGGHTPAHSVSAAVHATCASIVTGYQYIIYTQARGLFILWSFYGPCIVLLWSFYGHSMIIRIGASTSLERFRRKGVTATITLIQKTITTSNPLLLAAD